MRFIETCRIPNLASKVLHLERSWPKKLIREAVLRRPLPRRHSPRRGRGGLSGYRPQPQKTVAHVLHTRRSLSR